MIINTFLAKFAVQVIPINYDQRKKQLAPHFEDFNEV
jgi:hypothetical protein